MLHYCTMDEALGFYKPYNNLLCKVTDLTIRGSNWTFCENKHFSFKIIKIIIILQQIYNKLHVLISHQLSWRTAMDKPLDPWTVWTVDEDCNTLMKHLMSDQYLFNINSLLFFSDETKGKINYHLKALIELKRE